MKKLLVIILTTGLLAGCNNNNPFNKKEDTGTADKEEKTEKKKGGLFGGLDEEKKDNNSNWSDKDRNDWMNKCRDEFSDNVNAKKICSCVLDKIEQQYPNAKDAEQISNAEGERLVRACTTGINEEEGGLTGRQDVNGGTGGDPDKGSWTDLQRQTFIQGCATTAREKQGFSIEQANTYCDCMTRKVEKKYSFDQAARLRSEDLQTQEWIDAATDCRAKINQ